MAISPRKVEEAKGKIRQNIQRLERDINSGKLNDSDLSKKRDLVRDMERLLTISDPETFVNDYKRVMSRQAGQMIGSFASTISKLF